MAKIPHDEFGDEPARRDSYSQLKKIKKVLEKNKTLKVLFSDLETNIQEAFQVASFRVKSIEPLDFSSFNKNFYSCITLMELEIITA